MDVLRISIMRDAIDVVYFPAAMLLLIIELLAIAEAATYSAPVSAPRAPEDEASVNSLVYTHLRDM
jgi:hypothetical protein